MMTEEAMKPLGLIVRFILRPGAGDAFDALVRETLVGIRDHEPGTIVYAVHAVEGQPEVRVFYELYRTPDDLEAHEAQPLTRRFLDQRDEHVASYTVERLRLLSAKGMVG